MPVRPVTGIVAGLACLAAGVATTSLVGSSYAAGAGGLPTHVNSCWTTDNGAPVVDSFTLSTHAVDLTAAPATVTITVDAHDAGGPGPASGLAGIQVLALQYWADSSDTGRTNAGAEIPLHLVGTDWAGTYTIPQDSHAMQVQFTVGVDAVKGPDSDPLQPPATDILEVTSGHPDTTAPTLTDLSLSTDHVDVSQRGQNVRVTAQIADDDTGLSEAKVFAPGQVGTPVVPLTPTGTPGEVAATIHVSRWVGADHLPLYLQLTDAAGNERTVTPQDLAGMALPSQIDVAGSPKDPADPRVVSVGGTPTTVDVRRDNAHWKVRVHTRDKGSGVGTVLVSSANLTDTPAWRGDVSLHLVSGNRHDGVWGARIPIRRCAPSPGRTAGISDAVDVRLRDRTGRLASVQAEGPKLRGPDHTPPGVRGTSGPGVVGLDFVEAVHGISRGTTKVVSLETLDETPQVVHGSWLCTNAHRTTVSCATGAVRHARFRYNTGPAASYVDLEPDGHLDVLDRSGNPVPHAGIWSLDQG